MDFVKISPGDYSLTQFASSTRIGKCVELLFKEFQKNHDWNSIITNVNLDHPIDTLYDDNGFIQLDVLEPAEWIVAAGKRYRPENRHQPIHSHPNVTRIFDAGSIKYLKTNNEGLIDVIGNS